MFKCVRFGVASFKTVKNAVKSSGLLSGVASRLEKSENTLSPGSLTFSSNLTSDIEFRDSINLHTVGTFAGLLLEACVGKHGA